MFNCHSYLIFCGLLIGCYGHPIDPKVVLPTADGFGIVIIGAAFLITASVAFIACACCKERSDGFKPKEDEIVYKEEFRNPSPVSQVGFSNNLSSEVAIFPPPVSSSPVTSGSPPPLRHPQQPQTVSLSRPALFASHIPPVSDWFAEPNANFPRQQLFYQKEIGKGWFGKVIKGEARGVKVVVRILREDATSDEKAYFLHEAKPFRDLRHKNVARLFGRCLEHQPYLLLFEFCSNGDLKSFLVTNAASRNAITEQKIGLKMMIDVTEGLKFMNEKGFIHTDLAARNCLVTSDLTVKIGDYGTSIDKYKNEYYIVGEVAVPVRWCAPETLHCTATTIETKEVTEKGNVWSLGVLLWEIAEFGKLPYQELADDQVITRVLKEDGLRLPQPTSPSGQYLYNVMQLCWRPSESRATVEQVLSMLTYLKTNPFQETDFEVRWRLLKPNTVPVVDNHTPIHSPRHTELAQRPRLQAKTEFDSGVDLEIKTSTPATASPQPSVVSQESEQFLDKKQSPSLTNLKGSLEDVTQFDSWLMGVEQKTEEDRTFVRSISEAIKNLDETLALENTSSSSQDSSMETSKKPLLEFKLGPLGGAEGKGGGDSSSSDTEEETWRGRIERGEFTEKVREKSKSVTDLMVLTHIESEGSESDSLPSLTRQYSIKKNGGPKGVSFTGVGFGSEGNIRHAVLSEELQEKLKQSLTLWKTEDQSFLVKRASEPNNKKISGPVSAQSGPCKENVTVNQPRLDLSREEVEPLFDMCRENQPTYDICREKEPTLEVCSVKEPTFDVYRKKEPAIGICREEEVTFDVSREKEPKFNVCTEKELTFDISRGGEPTLDDSRKEDSRFDELQHEEPTVSLERGSTFNVSKKEQPIFAVSWENEPTLGVCREKEPSLEVCRKKEPAIDICTEEEVTFGVSREIEPKFNVCTEKELTFDISRGEEPASDDSRKEDSRFDELQHEEPTVSREKGSTFNVSKEEQPIIDVSWENEPTLNVCREKEKTLEVCRGKEPTRDVCREKEITFDVSREDEPTFDIFRENEPTLDVCREEERTDVCPEKEMTFDVSRSKDTMLDVCKEEKTANFVNRDYVKKTEIVNNVECKHTVENSKFSDPIHSIQTVIESQVNMLSSQPSCSASSSVPKIVITESELLSNCTEPESNSVNTQYLVDFKPRKFIFVCRDSDDEDDSGTSSTSSDEFSLNENVKNIVYCSSPKKVIENPSVDGPYLKENDEVLKSFSEMDYNSLMCNLSSVNISVDSSNKICEQSLDKSSLETGDISSKDEIQAENTENTAKINGNICDSPQRVIENPKGKLELFAEAKPFIQKTESAQSLTRQIEDSVRNYKVDSLESSQDLTAAKIITVNHLECDTRKEEISQSELCNDKIVKKESQRALESVDNAESSVILGSCEEHTMDYYKGLRTTFPEDLNIGGEEESKEGGEEGNESETKSDEEEGTYSDNLNSLESIVKSSSSNKLEDITSPPEEIVPGEPPLISNIANTVAANLTNNIFGGISGTVSTKSNCDISQNTDKHNAQNNLLNYNNCISHNGDLSPNNILINDLGSVSDSENESDISEYFSKEQLFEAPFPFNQPENIYENECSHHNSVKSKSLDSFLDSKNDIDRLSPFLDSNINGKSGFVPIFNMTESVSECAFMNRSAHNNYDSYFSGDSGHSSDRCMEQDRQMNDLKNRLEDVFKAGDDFQLKNSEEEYGGKLLTPDDERSSDSGFRDKGSLSESVEDTCDEKYNLEDIDAELDDFTIKNIDKDDLKYYEQCMLNNDSERESSNSLEGWFLHPRRVEEQEFKGNGWLSQSTENEEKPTLTIDDDFVAAIRNELKEKLPCALTNAKTEDDSSPEQETSAEPMVQFTYPSQLSPILEEQESNQSSILLEECSPVFILHPPVDEALNEKVEAVEVLQLPAESCTKGSLIVEDLDNEGNDVLILSDKVVLDDDVLIVDTETNEATIIESPKPHSHLAFVLPRPFLDNLKGEESPYDNSNLTPENPALSPESLGSASSSSSPDHCNMSGLYMSPCSVRSDLFDSGPPSLPFDLGQSLEEVEEIQTEEIPEIKGEGLETNIINNNVLIEDIDNLNNELVNAPVTPLIVVDTEVPKHVKAGVEIDRLITSSSNDTVEDNVEEIKSKSAKLQSQWLKELLYDKEAEGKLPIKDWPSLNELLPTHESHDRLRPNINSTLALLSPDLSSNESKSQSLLSSFASSPVVEEADRRPPPSSLSIVGQPVAAHSATAQCGVGVLCGGGGGPMPSPEDVDKEWRPTMCQLLELTDQAAAEEMTTSFIEPDETGLYTPDWESDLSEESSSSSGEFVWKEGDKEDLLNPIAHSTTVFQEPSVMEPIDEEDSASSESEGGREEDGVSECGSEGSGAEFIPSTWNALATPVKSALKLQQLQEGRSSSGKKVIFKKEKYQCIYEYPRELSDDEEEESGQVSWTTPPTTTVLDYSMFTDWELGEGETGTSLESVDSDTEETRRPSKEPHLDIYRLDYNLPPSMMGDEGETFISSSSNGWKEIDEDLEIGEEEFTPIASDVTGLGGLRHARAGLRLELPPQRLTATAAAAVGEASFLDSGL